MPKSICIGDPLYFEDKKGLDLTYERDYKGLSRWKCEIQMIEDKLVYPATQIRTK